MTLPTVLKKHNVSAFKPEPKHTLFSAKDKSLLDVDDREKKLLPGLDGRLNLVKKPTKVYGNFKPINSSMIKRDTSFEENADLNLNQTLTNPRILADSGPVPSPNKHHTNSAS